MLKLLKYAIVGLVVAGLSGCVSTRDVDVNKAQSKKVDMKGYKTYMALPSQGIVIDSQGTWIPKNVDVIAEVENIVKDEMDKKHKRLVITNPDFYVAIVVGADMDAVKQKTARHNHVMLENVPAAGLAIVFIDAQTGVVIREATSEGNYEQNLSLKKRKERAAKTIRKMLKGM